MDAFALHNDHPLNPPYEIAASETESQEESPGVLQKALKFVFDRIHVSAELQNRVLAAIDEKVRTRLREDLDVPVVARVAVDTTVNTRVSIPLQLQLSADELGISGLEIDVDQKVTVEDTLEIDTNALVDSLVDLNPTLKDLVKRTLPLSSKALIKVNQPVRVHGTIRPHVKPFTVVVKKDVVVDLAVPIKQTVDVKGQAIVKVDQDVTVPIAAKIPVDVSTPLNIKVRGVSIKSKN